MCLEITVYWQADYDNRNEAFVCSFSWSYLVECEESSNYLEWKENFKWYKIKKKLEEHTKEFTILFELKPGKIKEIFYVQNFSREAIKSNVYSCI